MIETSEAVFSYAKQNKINKVIFLSSAAVYGNSLLKKSQRLNPLSDYGRLKKDCEDIFLSMKCKLELVKHYNTMAIYPRWHGCC